MKILALPIDSITIGKRQRSDVPEAHIVELAKDIRENGLIHAITISKNNELLAGFCRLSAIKTIKEGYFYASEFISPGFVPAAMVHFEQERDLFRFELMENLRRKNLSPIDEARAIGAMHRLYAANSTDWTERDTGQEVDALRGISRNPAVARDDVGDSLLIESFADDPDVAKAKSKSEAVKIAKKKLEAQFVGTLGALATQTKQNYNIIEGNAHDCLRQLDKESFSGVIVDPPYGIDADAFGEQTMTGGHEYEDSFESASNLIANILSESYRVCKPDAHLYLFCDIRYFFSFQLAAKSVGWKTFDTPLIWSKPGLGHAPQPGYFSRRYEAILFCQKGNRKLSKSRSDVFEFQPIKDKIHAAQKPAELYQALMELSFFPGESVLDPCAGSGTIFLAAAACKLKATGIEMSPNYANICRQVIDELNEEISL